MSGAARDERALAAHSARTVVEDRVIGDPSGSTESAMPSFQVEPKVRDTEMTVSAFFPYCAPQSGPPCVAATSQLNFGPGKTSCTVDQRLLVALAGLEILRPGLFLALLCQRKIELRQPRPTSNRHHCHIPDRSRPRGKKCIFDVVMILFCISTYCVTSGRFSAPHCARAALDRKLEPRAFPTKTDHTRIINKSSTHRVALSPAD
jgi:hypothetical protein